MAPIKAPHNPSNQFQPIDFGHTSNEGRSGFESSMRLVNGYVEKIGKAKTPIPVYATPGTTRFDKTSTLSGGCRGMQYVTNKGLYVLAGTSAAVFNQSGNGAAISGTIPNTGLVYMAQNKAANPQIGIVTADQNYFVLDTGTNTITPPNDLDLPSPNSVCALDGFLVFSIPDGRIFHTDINNALSVSALAFGGIGSSYGLLRVVPFRGTIIALGERTFEIFEDVGTFPFAFQLNRTSYNIGTLSGQSAAVINENLLWVDHNGQVRKTAGFAPEVISIPAVERAIEDLTPFQRSLIYAVHTHFHGHDIYTITSVLWSWSYDMKTGLWHERQSLGRNNWFARGWENFAGLRVIGSDTDAAISIVDPKSNTENGNPFQFIAQSETVTAFPRGLTFDELRVDAIPGAGLTNAGATNTDLDAQDPQIVLTWSDDGGNTFAPPRAAPLGKTGQRLTPVSFYELGACGRGGRIFQLSSSSTVLRGLFLAGARMREYEV